MSPRLVGSAALALALGLAVPATAQTPVPFPRPGDPAKPQGQPPATDPKGATPRPGGAAQPAVAAPTEATLGMPVYPNAEFITSYDAGRGQRYYLFGTNTSFAETVAYYRNTLKSRGELVYEEPPIHSFDVGRFREETMAFPPGVTVKDYTWGGSNGYLVPMAGGKSQRFRTVIQIVPAPGGSSGR
jgi:hypothetical protein